MDVNEDERISNFNLRQQQKVNGALNAVLYYIN